MVSVNVEDFLAGELRMAADGGIFVLDLANPPDSICTQLSLALPLSAAPLQAFPCLAGTVTKQ